MDVLGGAVAPAQLVVDAPSEAASWTHGAPKWFFVSEQCVLPNPHRPGKTSTIGREFHIVSTYMRRKTLDQLLRAKAIHLQFDGCTCDRHGKVLVLRVTAAVTPQHLPEGWEQSPALRLHLEQYYLACPISNAPVESLLQLLKHGGGRYMELPALLQLMSLHTCKEAMKTVDVHDLQQHMGQLRAEVRRKEDATAAAQRSAKAERQITDATHKTLLATAIGSLGPARRKWRILAGHCKFSGKHATVLLRRSTHRDPLPSWVRDRYCGLLLNLLPGANCRIASCRRCLMHRPVKAMGNKKRGVKASCANAQKAREVVAQLRAAKAEAKAKAVAAEAEAQEQACACESGQAEAAQAEAVTAEAEAGAQANAGADEAKAQLHQLQAALQHRERQLADNQRLQQLQQQLQDLQRGELQRKEQQLADLVAQQQAALLQWEQHLAEQQQQLQQQQADLRRREQDLTERHHQLQQQQAHLRRREKDLVERQHQLQQQQADLHSREQQLTEQRLLTEQQARIQSLQQQLHRLPQQLEAQNVAAVLVQMSRC
ncbi:hypothetical protein QJQ45_015787 [Haematococcus lacustris]|nr:hypothetical protein QJQ45_015787 [Haematococcus lacustris]